MENLHSPSFTRWLSSVYQLYFLMGWALFRNGLILALSVTLTASDAADIADM